MAPSSSAMTSREAREREDLEKVKNDARFAENAKVDPKARHESSSRSSRHSVHHRHTQSNSERSSRRDRSRSPYRHAPSSRHNNRSRSRSPWRPGKDHDMWDARKPETHKRRAEPNIDGHRGSSNAQRRSGSPPRNMNSHYGANSTQKRSAEDREFPAVRQADSRVAESASDSRDAESALNDQPVSRLAKRRRIAEVMAEANARQQRLSPSVAASPSHQGSAISSNQASPQHFADSPGPDVPATMTDSRHLQEIIVNGNSNSNVSSPFSPKPTEDVPESNGSNDIDMLDSQAEFTLKKEDGPSHLPEENETSAADYDPTKDLDEDRPDHKLPEVPDADTVQQAESSEAVRSASNAGAVGFDMFADDDEDDDVDMFAPIGTSKTASTKITTAPAAGLQHDYDDQDGYLRIIQREMLDGRYSIQTSLGKGVYASVVLATDTQSGSDVAIKIARNNDTMLKAGQHEVKFLTLLQDRDPSGKVPIIRLLDTFTYKKHFCLVFESLECDLRELLKKHGRNTGLDISAVKAYARQMFQALNHLEKAEMLHADLKPDNILVHKDNQYIKICDLGSATFLRDTVITDMLVSRFYRAPEIMIGMQYSYPIDMWAIGCTLFELYTGRILFNGQDNNRMLRMIQECRGKIPSRMIKKAVQPTGHFSSDNTNTFLAEEVNSLTGKTTTKPVYFQQPLAGKDIKSRLATGMPVPTGDAKRDLEVKKLHDDFVDLLDQCLKLDPEQRVKPAQALKHRFFASATAAPLPSKVVHRVAGTPLLPTSVIRKD